MNIDAQTLSQIHAQAGAMGVTGANTPCAWPMCERSAAGGDVMWRVNPKGEPGIFMCSDDARVYKAAGESS